MTEQLANKESHETPDLSDYERGYVEALFAYAWWKDGTQYVGSTGSTLKRAVEQFLSERGHPPDHARNALA